MSQLFTIPESEIEATDQEQEGLDEQLAQRLQQQQYVQQGPEMEGYDPGNPGQRQAYKKSQSYPEIGADILKTTYTAVVSPFKATGKAFKNFYQYATQGKLGFASKSEEQLNPEDPNVTDIDDLFAEDSKSTSAESEDSFQIKERFLQEQMLQQQQIAAQSEDAGIEIYIRERFGLWEVFDFAIDFAFTDNTLVNFINSLIDVQIMQIKYMFSKIQILDLRIVYAERPKKSKIRFDDGLIEIMLQRLPIKMEISIEVTIPSLGYIRQKLTVQLESELSFSGSLYPSILQEPLESKLFDKAQYHKNKFRVEIFDPDLRFDKEINLKLISGPTFLQYSTWFINGISGQITHNIGIVLNKLIKLVIQENFPHQIDDAIYGQTRMLLEIVDNLYEQTYGTSLKLSKNFAYSDGQIFTTRERLQFCANLQLPKTPDVTLTPKEYYLLMGSPKPAKWDHGDVTDPNYRVHLRGSDKYVPSWNSKQYQKKLRQSCGVDGKCDPFADSDLSEMNKDYFDEYRQTNLQEIIKGKEFVYNNSPRQSEDQLQKFMQENDAVEANAKQDTKHKNGERRRGFFSRYFGRRKVSDAHQNEFNQQQDASDYGEQQPRQQRPSFGQRFRNLFRWPWFSKQKSQPAEPTEQQ